MASAASPLTWTAASGGAAGAVLLHLDELDLGYRVLVAR